jgi:hypothetical protein
MPRVRAGFWLLTRGGVIERTGTGDSWVEYGTGVTTIDGTGAYLTPDS